MPFPTSGTRPGPPGPLVSGAPALTARPGITSRVVSSRGLTPTTHAIRLEKPADAAFAPTPFMFLELPTSAGRDVRPMSLATSPTRPYLEFAVRLSDSPFKRAFAGLRPGDEVSMSGPISRFVMDETRPAVLVAGGIGVTPLKGMAEFAADRELPIPVRLLFSNAAEAEIVYRDELDALERQNPRFRVLHTLTQTPDHAWRGATGRIRPELIRQAAGDLENPVYYISGTPNLVRNTWRMLRELGVPEGDVRVEAFRGYANERPDPPTTSSGRSIRSEP